MVGNFNNLIMLRVREEKTAELLTRQLRKVNVANRMLVSMAGDNSDVTTDIDFTSSGGDRIRKCDPSVTGPSEVTKVVSPPTVYSAISEQTVRIRSG
ncbi:hypothetical protein L861_06505 [Litchfieldella anticariensis FP35 = DSM 16096]|uniref:Uncharacterized protein n=1 Tax=Litchfieldella anticariensis (strain DSM 16096 / CECT 5854 / CIP 108499 / LMG 22089 / FP35) TaxID=1121939 RepID=S2KF94_LITA3|nr:hypothetical protein L861_06505 [Halomonas anticariensis FP35 = DSM 16096]